MPFVSPATVVTGTGIASAWGNSVKAATDFLANPPACRVYNNAAISINDNVDVGLTFNSERYDTDGMHSTSVLPGRINIVTAGLYLVEFTARFAAANDYVQQGCAFVLNTTTIIAGVDRDGPNAKSFACRIHLSTVWKFAAGDYVEVTVYHDNTANAARNIESVGNFSPEFAATWIGTG
jgi:hypothetical protein